MKLRLLLIFSFALLSFFGISESFSQDLESTEDSITWDRGNYRITNGTGTAKLIVTDYDKNQNPDFSETINVFVYSDSFPEGITLTLYETEKDSGVFERTFSLSNSRSAPNILYTREGDTAIAIYSDEPIPSDYLYKKIELTATVLIGHTGPPLERAPASNARIRDMNENQIHVASVGQQILLSSDIANNQNRNQTFVWIAQVTDSNKKTQALSWITGTLNPKSSFSPTTSWIPKDDGKYNVVFFVWESLTNPSALSPPIEMDFTVSGVKTTSENPDIESPCSGKELCLREKVIRIVDGDTLYLSGGYEVRLSLADTPERTERGFYEASQFTTDMCPVTSIAIVDQDDEQPYDAYGRILGKITCRDNVLNSELLYAGHATILEKYCSTSEFSNEVWAKEFGC